MPQDTSHHSLDSVLDSTARVSPGSRSAAEASSSSGWPWNVRVKLSSGVSASSSTKNCLSECPYLARLCLPRPRLLGQQLYIRLLAVFVGCLWPSTMKKGLTSAGLWRGSAAESDIQRERRQQCQCTGPEGSGWPWCSTPPRSPGRSPQWVPAPALPRH